MKKERDDWVFLGIGAALVLFIVVVSSAVHLVERDRQVAQELLDKNVAAFQCTDTATFAGKNAIRVYRCNNGYWLATELASAHPRRNE